MVTAKCKAVLNFMIKEMYAYNSVVSLRLKRCIITKRLNPLLYLCQLYHVEQHGTLLIEDEFQVNENGPVLPGLSPTYYWRLDDEEIELGHFPYTSIKLSDKEKVVIKYVLECTYLLDTSDICEYSKIAYGVYDESAHSGTPISNLQIFKLIKKKRRKMRLFQEIMP